MWNAGTTFTEGKKTLKCCPVMATWSLKMETQAGRLHSDHTQPQLMFRTFWGVRKANVQNLWGPGELMKLLGQDSIQPEDDVKQDKYSTSLPLMIHLPPKCWKCLRFHNKILKPEAESVLLVTTMHLQWVPTSETKIITGKWYQKKLLTPLAKSSLFTRGIRYNPQK